MQHRTTHRESYIVYIYTLKRKSLLASLIENTWCVLYTYIHCNFQVNCSYTPLWSRWFVARNGSQTTSYYSRYESRISKAWTIGKLQALKNICIYNMRMRFEKTNCLTNSACADVSGPAVKQKLYAQDQRVPIFAPWPWKVDVPKSIFR